MNFRKQPMKLLAGVCAAFLLLGAFPSAESKVNAADTGKKTEESDVLEVPAIKEKVLNVPKIKQNVLTVPPIEEKVLEVPNADILRYSGNITYTDQKDTYSFTAPRDGVYRFELADIDQTQESKAMFMEVYSPNGRMDHGTYENGEGITAELKENVAYKIYVHQDIGFGSYTLIIGQAKKIQDVTAYTKVKDSVEYTDQRNTYQIKAPRGGIYRFELADIDQTQESKGMFMEVYSPNGRMDHGSYENGGGLTVEFKANVVYTIYVHQETGIGSYTLIVGQAKELKDVTSYTKVKDSVEYTDQRNTYQIKAPRDGVYRFELADIDQTQESKNMFVEVYSPNGRMDHGTYENGGGITAEFKANVVYTIYVHQESGFSSYTLIVGQAKELKDVTAYSKVKDSVEYTDQRNTYQIKAPRSGIYRFELADIDQTKVSKGMFMEVYSPNGRMDHGSFENGEGITVEFKANVVYTIYVHQETEFGSYTLIVGQAKKTQSVDEIRYVKDSVQYTAQRNTYSFKAAADNTYRFELADIDQTSKAKAVFLEVYNPNGRMDYKTCANGEGLTLDLKKDVVYTIYVHQEESLGTYTLVIGKPGVTDITPTPSPKPTAAPTKKPAVTKKPTATPVPKDEAKKEIIKFVDRIYIFVLDRDPDKEGTTFWTNELYDFNRSGAEVAQGFIFSPEFVGRNTSDDEFVEILYKTFFGRDPEPEGFKFWTEALKTGKLDRTAVANGFIFSQEWANTCAEYGIRSGGEIKPTVEIKPTNATYEFVKRMYTTAMKREFDKEGCDFWANGLANFTTTGEQVGVCFFVSPEMEGYNLSDSEFIERLYKTFMDRDSEKDGKAFWLKFLESGHSRLEVVYGFTRSPEFVQKCIDARIMPY